MIKVEDWLLIRDLYTQGFSISEISRRTGHARATVRKYLKMKTAPEEQKRPPKSSILDPYKPYLEEKVVPLQKILKLKQNFSFTSKNIKKQNIS